MYILDQLCRRLAKDALMNKFTKEELIGLITDVLDEYQLKDLLEKVYPEILKQEEQ